MANVAVTIPREQALDSEIFCGITEKGVEMAKKMRSGTQVAVILKICPTGRARCLSGGLQ